MFAGEAVVVMSLISTGKLLLPPLVVLLKDVLFHVLPKFQCLSTVDPLGCLPSPKTLKLSFFSLTASLIAIPRRPADLALVYDLLAGEGPQISSIDAVRFHPPLGPVPRESILFFFSSLHFRVEG